LFASALNTQWVLLALHIEHTPSLQRCSSQKKSNYKPELYFSRDVLL